MFRDYSMQICVIQREDSREVWLKDKKAERCGKIKVNREKIVKQRVVVQRQVIIDVCFRERTRIQRRVVQRQDSHAEIQYVTTVSTAERRGFVSNRYSQTTRNRLLSIIGNVDYSYRLSVGGNCINLPIVSVVNDI